MEAEAVVSQRDKIINDLFPGMRAGVGLLRKIDAVLPRKQLSSPANQQPALQSFKWLPRS